MPCVAPESGHVGPVLFPDIYRDRFAFTWTFMGERFEQTPHVTDRHTIVDLEIIEGALRHAGISSVRRILNNCNAAALLDRVEARSTVVTHSGQDDSDHARGVGDCRGSK